MDIVTMYPGGDDRRCAPRWTPAPPGSCCAARATATRPRRGRDRGRDRQGGVVVALSTRVAAGPAPPVYGNGGGGDLVEAGAIPVTLPASQARIALALLMSSDRSPREVGVALEVYV